MHIHLHPECTTYDKGAALSLFCGSGTFVFVIYAGNIA